MAKILKSVRIDEEIVELVDEYCALLKKHFNIHYAFSDIVKKSIPNYKIGDDMEFARFVEYMISVEKYSPEAVLRTIKQKGLKFNTSVSKQTLYRYIEQGVFPMISNNEHHIKRNKKEQNGNVGE